jgi:hypothetical protein
VDVACQMPEKWWLEHDCCKLILSCLVHKDNNNDVSAKPTTQPPGHTCKVARDRRERALVEEHVVQKANQPVEKYGNVDHQMNKVQVAGMQSVVKKTGRCNCFSNDVMQRMKDMYVRMMGQEKHDK